MDILKELQYLEKNHPDVYDWIKSKAKWEGLSLSSVLIYYEKDIQKMIGFSLIKKAGWYPDEL